MARKNAAAQELGRRGGKARAQSLTSDELAEIGRKGATKRWAGMTPEERREATAPAVAARRKKARKRQKSKK